jgi:hypothetical protein
MLESLRQNWKLTVSLFSSVVAAAVIVCLLIDWRNSTATLSALFGALVVGPWEYCWLPMRMKRSAARESETFLSLRTEYKVLRAAIACISRSQDEGDEFKSV